METEIICRSSSALEKVLEHRFVAELSAALWKRGNSDFEVLRSEVDRHGYDLVIEANGVIRHIQLKALRRGGKRASVALNTRLATKPSGCVVWMVYAPADLSLGPFMWFGGEPGERLPELGDRVARHTKGNAQGVKTERPDHRIVRKGAFEVIGSMEALAERLFGPGPSQIDEARSDEDSPVKQPLGSRNGSAAAERPYAA
jgi:hypothetical protein